MKKRGPLLAAFCIPLLITLIICVNREIYPFATIVKVELEDEITYNLGHGEVVTFNE